MTPWAVGERGCMEGGGRPVPGLLEIVPDGDEPSPPLSCSALFGLASVIPGLTALSYRAQNADRPERRFPNRLIAGPCQSAAKDPNDQRGQRKPVWKPALRHREGISGLGLLGRLHERLDRRRVLPAWFRFHAARDIHGIRAHPPHG